MENLRTISTYPHFHNFTASSNTTQIQIPRNCRKVTIGSDQQALFLCRNGATDGGSVPTNKAFIPKSNYITIAMGRGSNIDYNLYVASQTGSANVSIILEEE
jgi:hypothetical protein